MTTAAGHITEFLKGGDEPLDSLVNYCLFVCLSREYLF